MRVFVCIVQVVLHHQYHGFYGTELQVKFLVVVLRSRPMKTAPFECRISIYDVPDFEIQR
jgi:hypothetical protein